MQAMIYRAHQLKAITDNQYQYMMRQVSKKGWRTNEPGDTLYYFNKNIFQRAIDVLFEADYLNPNTFLQLFKDHPIPIRCGDHMKLGVPSTSCSSDELSSFFSMHPFHPGVP